MWVSGGLIVRKWLRNIYPPKGAAIAEPVWGPIDFSYVLLFRVVFQKRTWVFQNAPYYPPFENSENALL